jgi:arylsulfatase A-like enzyme
VRPTSSHYKNTPTKSLEGISLVPLFREQSWKGHDAIYFEHFGNKAIRQGDWKLVSLYQLKKWELYNIKLDRSELNDLSDQYPEKTRSLNELYEKWAAKTGVIPMEKRPPIQPSD